MKNHKPFFSFEGCWKTERTDYPSGARIAGGERLSFKKDPFNPSRLTGGWSGTSVDARGNRRCGFLTGHQRGSVLEGNWYEIIYRDSAACPTLHECGTFKFTIDDGRAFTGTWMDRNGPSSLSDQKYSWHGTRKSFGQGVTFPFTRLFDLFF
jgi:hypothetical protein